MSRLPSGIGLTVGVWPLAAPLASKLASAPVVSAKERSLFIFGVEDSGRQHSTCLSSFLPYLSIRCCKLDRQVAALDRHDLHCLGDDGRADVEGLQLALVDLDLDRAGAGD